MTAHHEPVVDSDVLDHIVSRLRERPRLIRNRAVADGVVVFDRKPVVIIKTPEAVQRLRVAADLEELAARLETLGAS